MSVWLARHGATVAPGGVAIGWTDVGLSRLGRDQARELAARLAAVPLDVVLTSDLVRCRETAAAIASGRGTPVVATPDLRELNFGRWEGRRLEELWVESAGEAAAWESDIRRLPASFGETFDQFEARLRRFSDQIPADGEVVVVGHRGSLAVLWSVLTGSSLATAWERSFEPGSVTRVEAVAC